MRPLLRGSRARSLGPPLRKRPLEVWCAAGKDAAAALRSPPAGMTGGAGDSGPGAQWGGVGGAPVQVCGSARTCLPPVSSLF